MNVGLTLGKYAPFHKGHELVVQTMLSEMDHGIVMIYDSPEVTDIPLEVRAEWIRKLYPSAEVIEAWGGPSEVGYTPEIMRAQEEYILQQLGTRRVTHFYSSEPYGDHVSRALNAVNRTVDCDRSLVPVSGSEIRKNPYQFRRFISALVYRDHVDTALFLGAPSTGKSTLTEALAKRFGTEYMPEYGREYWEKNQVNRRLSPQQLVEIAKGHLEREEQLLQKANRVLFCDTGVLTTRIFALCYHGTVHPELEYLADTHQYRYSTVFLCDTDIPYADTEDRSGEANRQEMQKMIIEDLQKRTIPYFTIRGTLEERIAQVEKVLLTERNLQAPLFDEEPN